MSRADQAARTTRRRRQRRGGIQGQNILDVKPEVKPDASSDPKYMEQNNAERNKVQPGNNAPMWRGVQAGVDGYSSLPKSQAPEAGNLIQASGAVSRLALHHRRRSLAAGAQQLDHSLRRRAVPDLAGRAGHLLLHARARSGHTDADSGGRQIERFTPFERAAHWSNAIAFVILAVSGLVMAFGKFFLLPVMGLTLFGWLTYALKTVHNFVGPLFAVSLVIVFFTFVRDNLPQRGDLKWLLKAGGVFSKWGTSRPRTASTRARRSCSGLACSFLGSHRRGLGPVPRQADAQPGLRPRRPCRSRTWSTRCPRC